MKNTIQFITLIIVLISNTKVTVCENDYHYFRYSGWLPSITVIHDWKSQQVMDDTASLSSAVQGLADFIYSNPVIYNLTNSMINQWNELITNPDTPELNCNITFSYNLCHIYNAVDFLNGINYIITIAPPFHGEYLIGVPLAAYLTGFDDTLSGQTLFRLPEWNKHFQNILTEWHSFLSADASDYGFQEGGDWVTPRALLVWNESIWQKDFPDKPWYHSWNAFFTRQFKDRNVTRPIAGKGDNTVITSSNDGAVFRWRKNINRTEGFYFKDMPYSLTDIFKSKDPSQQAILDEFKLVERFINGSIFQTFLDPFNFHRWWAPVEGEVLFTPIVIDEAPMYYSKIVLPDYQGSTTYSLPYLLEVNSRGILVLDTTGYGNIGYVCVIPIGMVEVSTIVFTNQKGDIVEKGKEVGYFQFGGSSFAIIFEDTKKYNKNITFSFENGTLIPSDPPLPSPTGDSKGEIIIGVGSQIAKITTLSLSNSTVTTSSPEYECQNECEYECESDKFTTPEIVIVICVIGGNMCIIVIIIFMMKQKNKNYLQANAVDDD